MRLNIEINTYKNDEGYFAEIKKLNLIGSSDESETKAIRDLLEVLMDVAELYEKDTSKSAFKYFEME